MKKKKKRREKRKKRKKKKKKKEIHPLNFLPPSLSLSLLSGFLAADSLPSISRHSLSPQSHSHPLSLFCSIGSLLSLLLLSPSLHSLSLICSLLSILLLSLSLHFLLQQLQPHSPTLPKQAIHSLMIFLSLLSSLPFFLPSLLSISLFLLPSLLLSTLDHLTIFFFQFLELFWKKLKGEKNEKDRLRERYNLRERTENGIVLYNSFLHI